MPEKSGSSANYGTIRSSGIKAQKAGSGKLEGPRLTTAGKRIEDTVEELLSLVTSSLDDDKAEDIVTFDLQGKSSIADYIVIASGRSTRQVAALTDKLVERIKQAGHGPVRVEGQQTADWVVVDAGDVVVHIFRPEVRDFYNLEKLWSQSTDGDDMFSDNVTAGSGSSQLKSPTHATAH